LNVVADTNVVISAIFWPGDSRQCFALWAKRRFQLVTSALLLEEYREVAMRMAGKFPEVNPEPWLKWIERKGKLYEPVLLGKQLSRDIDDDGVLACALAANAKVILSKDADLLVLEKPFGIAVLTPRQFLAGAS
jgi:putative PIN family toxin of toxin-antitoxin system